MNKDTLFTFIVCFAMIEGFEARQRQDAEIKACQEDIAEVRQWLDAKFPPSKWEQMRTLQNVLRLGRQLTELMKDIRPEDRSGLSFAVYDFANSNGGRVRRPRPKMAG